MTMSYLLASEGVVEAYVGKLKGGPHGWGIHLPIFCHVPVRFERIYGVNAVFL
jgi:hypothetical protein